MKKNLNRVKFKDKVVKINKIMSQVDHHLLKINKFIEKIIDKEKKNMRKGKYMPWKIKRINKIEKATTEWLVRNRMKTME